MDAGQPTNNAVYLGLMHCSSKIPSLFGSRLKLLGHLAPEVSYVLQ